MNGFWLGFMLGMCFGVMLLVVVVANPVVMAHIRDDLDRKLTDAEEQRGKK